jgi:hypothetical protein
MTAKTRRKAPKARNESMLRRPGLQRLRRSRGSDGLRQQGSGAFSACRTLRFQGCGFFMTWPGRRTGARAKGVHGPTLRYDPSLNRGKRVGHPKGQGNRCRAKVPSRLPRNSGQVRASPSIRFAPLRARRRYIKRQKQIPRRCAPRDDTQGTRKAPGPATEKRVAAPWATRAAAKPRERRPAA